MKIVRKAFAISFVLHLLYLVQMFVVGYIKTRSYEPDFVNNWENVDVLQSEVAFGSTVSPLFFVFTFVAVAVIFGILLLSSR